ncbi:MAG: hypothetical protein ACI4WH_07745 [Oscillospiraceae bacterium]
MIKTVRLSSNVETKIDLVGGQHVRVKNLGDTNVYVSKKAGVVAEADGVKSIQCGSAELLTDVAVYQSQNYVFDWYGSIYAVSDSDCKIELETTTNTNFRVVLKGGDGVSATLDTVLSSGVRYQLGVLTSDITLTLPETATSDIEVDFAVSDTTYSIACDYLSLDVVPSTYYQVIFSYDKALNTWFSSVVSSDYTPVSTLSEVATNETT